MNAEQQYVGITLLIWISLIIVFTRSKWCKNHLILKLLLSFATIILPFLNPNKILFKWLADVHSIQNIQSIICALLIYRIRKWHTLALLFLTYNWLTFHQTEYWQQLTRIPGLYSGSPIDTKSFQDWQLHIHVTDIDLSSANPDAVQKVKDSRICSFEKRKIWHTSISGFYRYNINGYFQVAQDWSPKKEAQPRIIHVTKTIEWDDCYEQCTNEKVCIRLAEK